MERERSVFIVCVWRCVRTRMRVFAHMCVWGYAHVHKKESNGSIDPLSICERERDQRGHKSTLV